MRRNLSRSRSRIFARLVDPLSSLQLSGDTWCQISMYSLPLRRHRPLTGILLERVPASGQVFLSSRTCRWHCVQLSRSRIRSGIPNGQSANHEVSPWRRQDTARKDEYTAAAIPRQLRISRPSSRFSLTVPLRNYRFCASEYRHSATRVTRNDRRLALKRLTNQGVGLELTLIAGEGDGVPCASSGNFKL